MSQRTRLNEDVYLCMQLVAPYLDITTQLHINDIIVSYNGITLDYICHNPAWDLQYVTEDTLQRVTDVILSSYYHLDLDYAEQTSINSLCT